MSVSALASALMLAGAPVVAAEMPPAPEIATPVQPAPTDPAPAEPAPQTTAQPADQPPPAAPASSSTTSANPAEAGTIIVRGRPQSEPGDPIANVNAVTFSATQAVDDAVIAPVSMAYKRTVPKPIRSGTRHFLNNLGEPVVFLNYLLQLKPGKAMETLGRFTINSTIGIAGVIDVAKERPFNLPRRPNGFGYTLGYYGVKPGAYLFLPIIGPTTVRDLFGRWIDLLVLPLTVGRPFTNPAYSVGVVTFRGIDDRAQSDERLRQLREGDKSFYVALREDYLNTRQAEIDALRGKPMSKEAPLPVAEPPPTPTSPAPLEPPPVEQGAGEPQPTPPEPQQAPAAQPQKD